MLKSTEALNRILATITPLTSEIVNLAQAYQRILAKDINASHPVPPFDNSAMDGYAVRAEDIAMASSVNPVSLRVIEDIPAGYAPLHTLQPGTAARIMTGAPVPDGANAVIPVEETHTTEEDVQIFINVPSGAYIRQAGEDMQAGETILSSGRKLRAADLGVLAGTGHAQVPVRIQPKVAVISTGDELLSPDQPLTPGKIRDMNSYTLPPLILEAGGIPLKMGIAGDTAEAVRTIFQNAIDQGAHLIVSSAGVSVGAYDVVRDVLESMGEMNFWKVNMRPGKPLTFGQIQGTPFLGLPGNPVSTMVTFEVFARPIIQKMLSLPPQTFTQKARLDDVLNSDGRLTFARVTLHREDGELVARSTGSQSSGVLSSMVKADGLLVIPEGIEKTEKGTYYAVRPFSDDL